MGRGGDGVVWGGGEVVVSMVVVSMVVSDMLDFRFFISFSFSSALSSH